MIRPRAIAPGISSFAARTPTLPPATHTNSYALGERDLLLIEPATPYEDERRAFIEWAQQLRSTGRRIVALFVTHHHADHVGGAAFLSETLGLPLWGHAETAARMSPPFARTLRDGEAITLDGPNAQRWEVLHTPGHAPGHLCLWEPELRQVVVGDMVASVGTILVEPTDGHMISYLAQLTRLAELGARCALPAHGNPIENPTQWFQFYVSHRLMREAKILDSLRRFGPKGATATELVPTAYADTPQAAWGLAELSTCAHLIKLVADGRVREDAPRYVAIEP